MISRHHSLQGRSKDGTVPLIPGRKRSESAVMKPVKKKSPLPLRKGQTGEGTPQGSSVGLSVGGLSARPRSVSHTGSQDECGQPTAEDMEVESLTLSSLIPSDGSSELMTIIGGDDVDGGTNTPDLNRTRAAIDHIQQKIARTKELIKSEQTARDDNVNEYLKLASNADKQQLQRIKSVFEKKNQKSAQVIAQLQKKLENYYKRIRELETYGVASHRQPKEVLRDVSQGLSTGGTKYPSEDDSSSITSGSGPTAGTGTMSSPRNQPLITLSQNENNLPASTQTVPSLPLIYSSSCATSTLPENQMVLDQLIHKLQEREEECQRLQEDFDTLKNQMQQDVTFIHQALQEERYRYERLEEQMNDLIELHQNEIENLKQGITDMEEKVQYQSEERFRDMHEMLESFQTKISRMEHQQQQHQQLVTLEGIENSNARALLLKLINIALTVLQVVLLLVATTASILMPFLKTRVRVLTTSLLVVAIVLMCRQWPEIIDLVHQMIFNPSFKQTPY